MQVPLSFRTSSLGEEAAFLSRPYLSRVLFDLGRDAIRPTLTRRGFEAVPKYGSGSACGANPVLNHEGHEGTRRKAFAYRAFV